MKHLPFTANIGKGIVSLLQKQWKKNDDFVGCSIFEERIREEPCYAPTAQFLGQSDTDHFGLLFQGYSGVPLKQKYSEEAEQYLDCLIDPSGPFRSILPYLWHTTVKEILDDKGFVFKDLDGYKGSIEKVNLGLLWTFAQATRLMYETPSRMKVFQHARKLYLKDKPLQLFLCMSLQPWESITETTMWLPCTACHGEPLGHYAIELAGRFLTGNIVRHDNHSTAKSWLCFGKKNWSSSDYKEQSVLMSEKRLLPNWVSQFKKERTCVSL